MEEIMDIQALHFKIFIILSISREEFDRVHRRSPTVVSIGHGGLDPAYSYVAELPGSQMVHAKNANPNARRLADSAERMTEDCQGIFGGSDSKKISAR